MARTRPFGGCGRGSGGRTVHVSCLTFLRVLRPFGLATHRRCRGSRQPAAERAVAPVARLLDLAASRLFDREGASESESEELTPSALLDHLPDVAEGLRLVPEYDVDYLTWLFAELDRVGDERVFRDRVARGPLFAELVTQDRRVIGWYVSHLKPGGLCRVLQVAAQPRQASRCSIGSSAGPMSWERGRLRTARTPARGAALRAAYPPSLQPRPAARACSR